VEGRDYMNCRHPSHCLPGGGEGQRGKTKQEGHGKRGWRALGVHCRHLGLYRQVRNLEVKRGRSGRSAEKKAQEGMGIKSRDHVGIRDGI
jgi:hypothetical protein